MKKAEEILEEYNYKCYRGVCDKELFSIKEVAELLKVAQIDAIKETVKECADAAETYEYNHLDACSECGHTATYVDKDSILSVADKLIKEL